VIYLRVTDADLAAEIDAYILAHELTYTELGLAALREYMDRHQSDA
jgi:hypothetical protein